MVNFIIDVSKFESIEEYEKWEKKVIVGAFDFWAKVEVSRFPKKMQTVLHIEGNSEDVKDLAEKYNIEDYEFKK